MAHPSVALSSGKIEELEKTIKKPLPVAQRQGVSFPKFFTQKLEPGKTPYDDLVWELRTAAIANDKGAIIFEQNDVEMPADWSQTATNIVVSKYFHGKMGSPDRERSVRQLVHRVVDSITEWGVAGRYFKTAEECLNESLSGVGLAQDPTGMLVQIPIVDPTLANRGTSDQQPVAPRQTHHHYVSSSIGTTLFSQA